MIRKSESHPEGGFLNYAAQMNLDFRVSPLGKRIYSGTLTRLSELYIFLMVGFLGFIVFLIASIHTMVWIRNKKIFGF